MNTFIVRDGNEGFYDLEKYLSILDIDYSLIDCEPNASNEEIATQIFSNTGHRLLFILRQNQIISSYQIKNILTSIPKEVYSVGFPKICYNYRFENGKKIVESTHNSLFECDPADLWQIQNLSKSFGLTYEDVIFNMSADKSAKACLKNTHGLIFQFNKTT